MTVSDTFQHSVRRRGSLSLRLPWKQKQRKNNDIIIVIILSPGQCISELRISSTLSLNHPTIFAFFLIINKIIYINTYTTLILINVQKG